MPAAGRVHPGMRRGNSSPFGRFTRFPGSSRHAPGQRRGGPQLLPPRGFIPACAGATTARSARSSHSRVHPGMRRGNDGYLSMLKHHAGSSRHAPGQPGGQELRVERVGFIPACAGATTPPATETEDARVHPGMRRGNLEGKTICARGTGSSRHAPGQPGPPLPPWMSGGFIPACAGATIPALLWSRCRGVHPGMRRGNSVSPSEIICASGSSRHAPGQPPLAGR